MRKSWKEINEIADRIDRLYEGMTDGNKKEVEKEINRLFKEKNEIAEMLDREGQ